MRYRLAFLTGFALGLLAGARAGRERYDQFMAFSRKVAENPAVRKAAQTAGQKAGELTKAAAQQASQQAAQRLPKLTETAKNSADKVKNSAEKVRSQLGRSHNGNYDAEHATVNGSRPGGTRTMGS